MVDDDASMLDLTKIFLERSGDIRVDCIQSAKDALERLKENGHYDVMVSDYMMPEMDGISLLKQIRGQKSNIPFIIFTGRGREEVVIEALNNGADYYLQKNSDPKMLYAELAHQIRQAAERVRANKAVIESEEKYRRLFAGMNECFYLCELVRDAQNSPVDFLIKEANSQVKLVLGLEPQDLIGKRGTEISGTETPPSLHFFANVVETGSPARFESYLPSVDRHFRVSAFPAVDGQFGVIFSDITDHKRMTEDLRAANEDLRAAQEDLRGTNKRLHDIIEFLPDATFVVDCNRSVVSWNRAAEELTGISRVEIMREGARLSGEALYKAEKPLLMDEILSGDAHLEDHYDFVIRRRDSIYAECFVPSLHGGEGAYICIVASPLFDQEGRMIGAIETIRDITERREALLDLYEARDYMESLLHSATAPMVVWSPELKIVRFNRAFERLTGYSSEEMVDRDVTALFSDKGRKLLKETDYALNGEGWEPVEIPIRCRDGSERTLLWNSAKVFSHADGSVVATIVQGLDITEMRQAEEELSASYRTLEEIIEFLPDATFVVDQEGKVMAWNRAIEEMTGISKKKIMGKGGNAHGKVFYGTRRPMLIDLVFSDDQEIESLFQQAKRVGNTIFAESVISPPRGVKGIYAWAAASPLFGDDGNPLGAIESIRDITEMVETGMALQDREERLRLIIEAADLGIWDRDLLTGEVVRNRRLVEIFGYDEDELFGAEREREKMIHPDDFGRSVSVLKDHLENRTPYYELDYRLKRKDGEWIWVHDRGEVTERDDKGRPLRMLGITQDVTRFWQSQLALQEANKKLNLLSSVTRHDILNQISILSGYATLLTEIHAEDDYSESTNQVLEQINKIEKKLVFTRDYQNMGVKAPEWYSVGDLLRRAADSAPSMIGDVELDISTGGLEVFSDSMLEKVFDNLIDNSLMHGGGVKKIRASCFEKKGAGVLVIEDDGLGVPAEMKTRIFEPGLGRHNGYGLFLSREILGITGMTITENGEEGKGARFEITIPRGYYRGLT
ncbi:MAG TPA: PAS domain S-box protein [Methanothrix sp.]|nr:PAS domain S-box protein [Methanothrix sp.]